MFYIIDALSIRKHNSEKRAKSQNVSLWLSVYDKRVSHNTLMTHCQDSHKKETILHVLIYKYV